MERIDFATAKRREGIPACWKWSLPPLLFFFLFGSVASAQEVTLSGRVIDAQNVPLAEAEVTITELGSSTQTDQQGRYQFSVAPGVYTVAVTKVGFLPQDKVAQVEVPGPVTLNFQIARILPQFGQEIVVIGTRAARTAVETPVPVDVLITEEIREASQVETSRIIQFLAPSFNFSTSTISDGTDIVRPSTLRGLGPDQTLVLINGKRRHNSALVHVNGSVGRGTAGVDLNAIPASAIKKIEILRDGASAQYGSDAIAGVLNIVLQDQTEYTEIDFSAGQTFKGDGESFVLSANHGERLGQRGFINLTAEWRDRGFTNRAGADPRQQFLSLPDGSPDPREATFNRINHRYGDAESNNISLFANSEIGLGEQSDLYFFGGASQRDGESAGFYRRSLDSRNVPQVHPEGFLPLINTDVEDLSLTSGFRHRFGAWALDASLTLGANAFEFFISNSVNASLGAASSTAARAGTLNFRQQTFNLDFFGTVQGDLPRPINLAFGAEVRRDNYEIEAGELTSYVDGGVPNQFGGRAAAGIQVFPGFRPSNQVDESRSNVAGYVDAEIPLSEEFLLGLAGRFEHYSDFGSNLSGKLAGRYEFTPRFAVRGSVSNGFRAPSLHQSFFNNTSTQFVFSQATGELVPFEVGTFRNDSAIVQGFGVAPLQEETSLSYSLGFTARPADSLSLTADVFKTDIDDRIVISGQFQAETDASGNPVDGPIRRILEPFGANAAQFFTNAIDTETEGVDVVLAYFKPIAETRSFSFTAAANWNRTQVVGTVRTPPVLAGLGETLFDRIERERIEYAQPRAHYNISAKYRHGGFTGLVRFNYFGNVKTVESASNPAIDQVFPGEWLTDLEFAYKFQSGLRLAVGSNNIFDVFPDPNRPEISFNGIFVYPRRTAPFGFNGGSWYTRISYRF